MIAKFFAASDRERWLYIWQRFICCLPLSIIVLTMSYEARAASDQQKQYMRNEYAGNAKTTTSVTVAFKDRSYTFAVKDAATRPRFLVTAPKEIADKLSGSFLHGLAPSLLGQRLDPEPFRLVAHNYLIRTGRKNCSLVSGGQATENQYEWTYACGSARNPKAGPQ